MGNKHKYHGNKFSQKDSYNSKESENNINAPEEEIQEMNPADIVDVNPEAETNDSAREPSSESNVCEDLEREVVDLKAQVEKEKKEYLFLMAEFDNFRKRTLKEKSEIIKNAGENVLKGLLPIMDDFERGIKAAENSPEADSVKEGVKLIYNKLQKYLNQNGVK